MNEKDNITLNDHAIDNIDNAESNSDTQEMISDTAVEETPDESVESLKSEIDRLRAELEESRSVNQRVADDISEFHRLFPNVELGTIPDEVRESVRAGIPLSASYSLYEKRLDAERERIEAINRKNAQRSSGAAGKNTPKEYFSPEDVRSMSQSEVRENYKKIIDSMKKWN